MTSEFAFVIGAMIGLPIGCMIGVFIYYAIRFRSARRAWCRTVHRHTGQWSYYGHGRRCDRCGRDWHRSY